MTDQSGMPKAPRGNASSEELEYLALTRPAAITAIDQNGRGPLNKAIEEASRAALYNQKDDNLNCVAACDLALDMLRYSPQPALRAWVLSMKATCFASSGLRQNAMELATEARDTARTLDDPELEARALNAIAFIGIETEDYAEAADVLKLALNCAREGGSFYDLFWSQTNLAHLSIEMAEAARAAGDEDRYQEMLAAAFRYGEGAQKTAQQSSYWRLDCYAKMNLAGACLLSKNYDRARILIKAYAAMARSANNHRLMGYANLDEAKLLDHENKITAAIGVLEDPHHLETLCETDDLRLRSREALASLEEKRGNFKTAYEHLQHARVLDRRVQAFKASLHINMVTTQLRLEDAMHEAARLQAEANELEIRNRLLEVEREELQRNAMLDALTKLGNRRAAEASFQRALNEARETGTPFHIAYSDVDFFKSVNDTFGHQIGDDVLVQIGQILQSGLRGRDEVFRFGGEEFVIVLHDNSRISETEICERLRRLIQEFDWTSIHPDLSITASFGVTTWDRGTEVEVLIAQADRALYEAKSQGRNCVIGSRSTDLLVT